MSDERLSHEEFFKRFGEQYLHPKLYGESIWPLRIEDLYQAFKARMLEELRPPNPPAE